MLKVLVTGAAGLIGGETCARLVASGATVTALVRRTRQVRANSGVQVPVARIVNGDVTQPLMGLDAAEHDIDVVIHCAASLAFDAPEEELRRDNVEGTRNALEFARACDARFLHVSTAYVCGFRDGLIEEGPVPKGTKFANGYEASKAAAEQLVAASGIPFAIARPSITLGDSTTGAIRDFPSLCNVFRLMARGKISTFPADPASTLDLVPIDHVAEGLARIAAKMGAAKGGWAQGGWFHLVGAAPTPSAALAESVTRIDHFPAPQVVAPKDYDPALLHPAEQRVGAKMLSTFGSYFRRAPQFDDKRFRSLTGLSCPPTDEDWIDQLIAYGIAVGYLPSAPIVHRDSAAPNARARPAPTETLS